LVVAGALAVAAWGPVAADAAPGSASRSSARAGTPVPSPAALPALPESSTYARQILMALDETRAEPPRPSVVLLGGVLDHPARPTQEIINAWATQSPHIDQVLEHVYQQYLDRPIDVSGGIYWRSAVLKYRMEGMIRRIATGSEAHRRAGTGNAAYVDWAYQHVLHRDADPSGKQYWVGYLDRGRPEWGFIDSLLYTNGRLRGIVRDAYLRYLRRPADTAGLNATVQAFTSRTIGELDLPGRLLGSSEARRSGCDPFDTRNCVLPFPNDLFTVPDPAAATGKRIGFKPEWSPANDQGKRADPTEWNRNDGFSVGQAALLRVPGIDLAKTGAAPLTDIGSSLDADAPIVVIDADTGEHHPIFTELDQTIPEADRAQDQLLYIRPAMDYTAGHRYIVALRNLKDGSDAAIPAPAAFTTYRDDVTTDVPRIEDRRAHMNQVFDDLEGAGVARDDLYMAWDFTVASTANTTGRMLTIRDQALASLGGDAPQFTVTTVTPNPATGVARRVEGTFKVPLFLTGDGSAGHGFMNGPDGLPQRNGTYTANFDCEIPTTALTTPARPVVYGHGLFGDRSEVRSGAQRAMVTGYDMTYCATEWIGMSNQDVGNAVNIIHDVSTFNTLTDRSQQGILNTIFLGRLMKATDGFVADAAFQNDTHAPVLDTSALFYDGNSQGAVIGGAYLAVSPDTTAGVLGVAGMNYSTLLERSVDFDPFRTIMATTYLDPVDRVVGLGLIQMLWDRGETNGYAAHIATNPLPNTPAKRVLIHVAVGDHQVAPLTAEVEARTIGIPVHRPPFADGRSPDVDPAWNLPAIDYPSTGPGGLVFWDSGSPLPPIGNLPPRDGHDPHEDPRNAPAAQQQKDQFLKTDGQLIDTCGAAPCTAPQD
jgi:hypothetical protein